MFRKRLLKEKRRKKTKYYFTNGITARKKIQQHKARNQLKEQANQQVKSIETANFPNPLIFITVTAIDRDNKGKTCKKRQNNRNGYNARFERKKWLSDLICRML